MHSLGALLICKFMYVQSARVRPATFNEDDHASSMVSAASGKGKTCQYVARLGRPTPKWRSDVTAFADLDFRDCRAKCDNDDSCVAFVRRAKSDLGYLASAENALVESKEDPAKLLEVPDDLEKGDCWLVPDVPKFVKPLKERKSVGKLDIPFRRLSLKQKHWQTSKEKVTYEKRDCDCDYRYLGLQRSAEDGDLQSPMAKCEGEYRFLGKEYPEWGVEALYQRTDGEKFLYMCTEPRHGSSTLRRSWYCMDKDEPTRLGEQAKNASLIKKIGFAAFGTKLFKFDKCLGTQLSAMPQPPLDLPAAASSQLSFPRVANISTPFGDKEALLTCGADKKESAEKKKAFLLHTTTCHVDVVTERVAWASWLNENGTAQTAIKTTVAASLRSVFSLGFFHQERSYSNIVHRAIELWEIVEKVMGYIYYIQGKKTVSGGPMTEGEKYACAENMVNEIKGAAGIMPKIAQTLALKPDVVKDDFVREALKSTQTENPARNSSVVATYIERKEGEAARESAGHSCTDGLPKEDPTICNVLKVVDPLFTIATGSVGQVLMAQVKDNAWANKLCGKTDCKVILKVVFDETEKSYQDDWTAVQFMGDTLLKLVLDAVNVGPVSWAIKTAAGEEVTEKINIGVSAGYDTWRAMKQGMGAIMDEFDLGLEHSNTKKGQSFIREFNKDTALKAKLGLNELTFDAPDVYRTSSRYLMIQTLARGQTLTAHHAAIAGQAKELKEWRTQIYPGIIGLYGYLIIEKGFFQGDPHPGNWFWEAGTKTLTLIDWGLADDLSAGYGRAGEVYHKFKNEVTQETLNDRMLENKCKIANFYMYAGDFRRNELICNGFEAQDGVVGGAQLFVPAAGPSWLLADTEVRFDTKYHGVGLDAAAAATGDAFFEKMKSGLGGSDSGVGPLVVQRRRARTCFDGDECGYGWEIAAVDGIGKKVFVPKAACVTEDCVKTSTGRQNPGACKAECSTVDCIKSCEKFTSLLPSIINGTRIRATNREPVCSSLPTREQAYKTGALTLGYKTATSHPVVLALFAALHTNDLLDLSARQENIQNNDPQEKGVELPDYSAVLLRCLQVFLGMVQDMITTNRPPFVPIMVSEFMMDTGPDEMFTYWHVFAKRFLGTGQCAAA
jgi:predicted unusual protein kinase regulating ubiquinone biosynthesis (AarF/ABC1/UbiB family)